jgi:hypothetical protein
MSEVGAFQLIKQGNLRVEIHFVEALAETINVVLFAEFDNVIEIDRNRQVVFDYSAYPVLSHSMVWIRISHKGRRYAWVICFWHRPP